MRLNQLFVKDAAAEAVETSKHCVSTNPVVEKSTMISQVVPHCLEQTNTNIELKAAVSGSLFSLCTCTSTMWNSLGKKMLRCPKSILILSSLCCMWFFSTHFFTGTILGLVSKIHCYGKTRKT